MAYPEHLRVADPKAGADWQIKELATFLETHFPEICKELEGQRIANVAMQIIERMMPEYIERTGFMPDHESLGSQVQRLSDYLLREWGGHPSWVDGGAVDIVMNIMNSHIRENGGHDWAPVENKHSLGVTTSEPTCLDGDDFCDDVLTIHDVFPVKPRKHEWITDVAPPPADSEQGSEDIVRIDPIDSPLERLVKDTEHLTLHKRDMVDWTVGGKLTDASDDEPDLPVINDPLRPRDQR